MFTAPRCLRGLKGSNPSCSTAFLPPGSLSSPTPALWRFASASTSTLPQDDLTFPSKSSPTPWEIFHFDPQDTLTPQLIKARFYQLAKIYHPDRQAVSDRAKGKAKDTSVEFKAIVAAYELLQSPSRRSVYLRGRGGGGAGPASEYSTSGYGYSFKRGRPYTPRGAYGAYPSASWDWSGDPYNPHFRPGAPGSRAGFGANTGWAGKGVYTSNGTFIVSLFVVSILFAPLTMWSVVPPELTRSSLAVAGIGEEGKRVPNPSSGWSRHEDAARALDRARREAREGGKAKREAIRRKVREIENARAYDRALEVQRIERAEQGTGHMLSTPHPALPPPSSSSAGN